MIDAEERDVDFIVDEEEWEAHTAREDAIEAAFKEAYGDEPLAPWQAEDR